MQEVQKTQVQSLGQEDPLEKEGNPLQYSSLENSMDRESGGLSPCSHKQLDTTELTLQAFTK